MRKEFVFYLRNNKAPENKLNKLRKLEIKPANKGYMVFVAGQRKYSTMVFSLVQINELFKTWRTYGITVLSKEKRIPKVFSEVQKSEN